MKPANIGRYEIQREIGRGGMAIVYLARDPIIDRPVAIKVLPWQLTIDPRFRERFRREARMVANLLHPAIVPVYDFGEDDNQLFLVMPYMKGGSLHDRLQRGPLPLAEAARILNELAPGLDAAHQRGMIHRDLKPANILFDAWDKPYLADFGITKLIAQSDTALTMTGGLVGTPAYMSPEQALAVKELDGRSDLYALGVIFFQMITGHTPFMADTPLGIAMKHVNEPVPRVADDNPTLPSGTQAIIDKALAKDREARYSSAATLAGAIGGLAAVRPVAPPPLSSAALAQEVGRSLAGQEQVEPAVKPRPAAPPDTATEILSTVRVPPEPAAPGPLEAAAPIVPAASPLRAWPSRKGLFIALAFLAVIILAGAAVAGLGLLEQLRDTPTVLDPPAVDRAGQLWVRPSDGVMMVGVPGGSFMMGSPVTDLQSFDRERPRHQIRLDSFWIDQTEITNASYQQCVDDGDCRPSAYPGDDQLNGPERPVVGVVWSSARDYCAWAGGQLPTEAQWEYAARGPNDLVFPWGNIFDGERLNFCDSDCTLAVRESTYSDGYHLTADVGRYPSGASWVGALDMAGNVWEWVADWYGPTYYEISPADNPSGPDSGRDRVLRGGSWADGSRSQRSAYRKNYDPVIASAYFGFRCLVPAPAAAAD